MPTANKLQMSFIYAFLSLLLRDSSDFISVLEDLYLEILQCDLARKS